MINRNKYAPDGDQGTNCILLLNISKKHFEKLKKKSPGPFRLSGAGSLHRPGERILIAPGDSRGQQHLPDPAFAIVLLKSLFELIKRV
jgi:hypothetical protein